MKTLALLGLLLLALPLRADILANGGFADGTAHWNGDAHVGDNGGIVIRLDPVKWTSVSQTFDTRETALDFTMSVQASSDFHTYSSGMLTPNVFASMTGLPISRGVRLKPDSWLLMVVDPTGGDFQYDRISLKAGSTDTQAVRGSLANLVAHEEKTIYLAFPPGQGSITLLNIALTPKGAATSSDSSPFSN